MASLRQIDKLHQAHAATASFMRLCAVVEGIRRTLLTTSSFGERPCLARYFLTQSTCRSRLACRFVFRFGGVGEGPEIAVMGIPIGVSVSAKTAGSAATIRKSRIVRILSDEANQTSAQITTSNPKPKLSEESRRILSALTNPAAVHANASDPTSPSFGFVPLISFVISSTRP